MPTLRLRRRSFPPGAARRFRSGSWISDTLNTKLTGDLHYITNDEDERPYVIVYTNGKAAQEKKYLTWVKVDDALIDRVGTSDLCPSA